MGWPAPRSNASSATVVLATGARRPGLACATAGSSGYYPNALARLSAQPLRAATTRAPSGMASLPWLSKNSLNPRRAAVSTRSKPAASTSPASGEPLISMRPNSSIEAKRAQPSQRQDPADPRCPPPERGAAAPLRRPGQSSPRPWPLRPRRLRAAGCLAKQAIAPGLFERRAHRHGEPAARRQHAPHLAQRAAGDPGRT